MSSNLVVYKASAGSGKTFTLAVQYIKLLITNKPQEYQHTLAVTFTNKATAEMKERILEQLYGISLSLKSSEGYVEALQKELKESGEELPVEEISNRCRWALHEILHDYSRFRVETIDSFFQSVLRNLARELGLSAKMQVDLNDKEVLSQAVDNMIDDLGTKDGDVLPWINNYIKERIENGDRWDVRDSIKDFAKCIFSEDFMRRDEEMRRKLTSDQNLNAFKAEMKKMGQEIVEGIQAEAKQMREVLSSSGLTISDISNGRYVEAFIQRVENFEDTLETSKPDDYFWTKSLETMTHDVDKFLGAKNPRKGELTAPALKVMEALVKLNEEAHKAMKPYLTVKLALKHLNPLRLLNHIDEEVTEITSESNRFILAKTPILLSRLIEGSDAPFVFEKMGTLFHHVMIDEFQDTSRLQWQNFKVLMLENQAQGGSDLLVGDIKQSIYRWRNGDWRILANIGEEMASHEPDIRNLDTNYRSEFNIIDFNNKFFPVASALLDKEDTGINICEDLYGDVEQCCKKKSKKGWVRQVVYKDSKNSEELMLEDLCQQVEMLHDNGVPYSEMCILQRDRNKVDHLIEYFKEHLPEVALVSDEAFKLESSRAINMMICALKVLQNGKRDTISIHLLMQQYLVDILGEEVSPADFAMKEPKDVLPDEFTQRIDELKTYPIHELFEELYRILHISNIKGEDSYLLSFYDELDNYLQNAPGDIASFLEFWEKDMSGKSIPACKVNGISIITIHKSKGLQYHTVLMPYCNFSFEKFKADELLWCDTQKPFDGMEVLPIQPGKKMKNSLFSNEMEIETLQKNIEELNALYVAFTRPEKNLLVWCNQDKTLTAGNVISRTLEKVALIDDEKHEPIETEDEETCTIYTQGEPVYELKQQETDNSNRLNPAFEQAEIAMCSHHRRHDFKQSTEGMLFIEEFDEELDRSLLETADGLTYAQQGSLLHEIFSQIEKAEQLEEVIQSYVDKGVLTNGKQVTRITKLISKALNHKDAKTWFDGSYVIQNECEITFIDPQKGKSKVLRPDRVMMSDKEIIVVDFKFGKPHPTEYHDQVKEYMQLMEQMYPSHQVKGYLWYIYRNQIEKVEP